MTILDDRFDYGEIRYITFALLNGQVISITHTETDEKIRIISVRKAEKDEENSITKKSETDWARIDAMTDEDIDFSDNPRVPVEMFAHGVLRKNFESISTKPQESLPVDRDIIEFFKSQDFNYPAKINQLLREYMEAHQAK